MLKTIIGFLKLPQTWTGIAAFLMAFGVMGPGLEFITREAANLALFFGLLAQFIGVGTAQRLSNIVNDYTARVENVLYKRSFAKQDVDAVVNSLK